MARKKGDGAKARIRSSKKLNLTNLSASQWNDAERILNHTLSKNLRREIAVANRIYAYASGMRKYLVSEKAIIKDLKKWREVSESLVRSLGGSPELKALDRTEFIYSFRVSKLAKLGKRPPLGFFRYALSRTLRLSSWMIEELPKQSVPLHLENQLWIIWVALLIIYCEREGIKIAASSSNKIKNPSVFVVFVQFLEGNLPDSCRGHGNYDAAVKRIHRAKSLAKKGERYLLAALAAFGKNLYFDYDAQGSSEQIEKWVAAVTGKQSASDFG